MRRGGGSAARVAAEARGRQVRGWHAVRTGHRTGACAASAIGARAAHSPPVQHAAVAVCMKKMTRTRRVDARACGGWHVCGGQYPPASGLRAGGWYTVRG